MHFVFHNASRESVFECERLMSFVLSATECERGIRATYNNAPGTTVAFRSPAFLKVIPLRKAGPVLPRLGKKKQRSGVARVLRGTLAHIQTESQCPLCCSGLASRNLSPVQYAGRCVSRWSLDLSFIRRLQTDTSASPG